MDKMSQIQKVLEYMEAGHTITSMDAFRMFYVTRLSDIIFRLRKLGHRIITHREKSKGGSTYARYELIGEAQNG